MKLSWEDLLVNPSDPLKGFSISTVNVNVSQIFLIYWGNGPYDLSKLDNQTLGFPAQNFHSVKILQKRSLQTL